MRDPLFLYINMNIHPHNLSFGSPKTQIEIVSVIPLLEIYLQKLLSTRTQVQTASWKHYFEEQKTRNNLHIHKYGIGCIISKTSIHPFKRMICIH